ncbi:MAG: hypothetical protein ACLP50_13055 [Solirubrobacteraceae bacterium]
MPLSVTSIAGQALSITGASIAGSDPADFAITADACATVTLDFRQTCTITVRFTPSGTGVRSAALILADNEPTPSVISLSGTGIEATVGPAGIAGTPGPAGATGASGPAGPTGPTGGTGATGATGPQGQPGEVDLVTCTAHTTGMAKHKKKTVLTCTTKLTSSPLKLTTTTKTPVTAVLARGTAVFATGIELHAGRRTTLLLTALQRLRPGRYKLTLTQRGIDHCRTITIR